jgi:hypothetical protein
MTGSDHFFTDQDRVDLFAFPEKDFDRFNDFLINRRIKICRFTAVRE